MSAIFPRGPSVTVSTIASPVSKSERPDLFKVSICKKISSLDLKILANPNPFDLLNHLTIAG